MLTDHDFTLGSAALHAAIKGEYATARAALETLTENSNIFGIALGWIDATLSYLTDKELELVSLPPEQSYESGRILTLLEGTDDVKSFEDTEPDVQWSSKLLFARARNDEATAIDMWEGQTDAEYRRRFWVLLLVCSSNIRRAIAQGVTRRRWPRDEGER